MEIKNQFYMKPAILVSALVFLLAFATTGVAADQVQMELSTRVIRIPAFYNGTTLEVTGTVPADADVVIRVMGPREDVHLKEKGKVFGFLWMNKTDVTLGNTPAVYMLYVPENRGRELLSPKLGLGYQALEQEVSLEPASEDKSFVLGEYVKLMEKYGVYNDHAGTVMYTGNAGPGRSFSATLTIPPKMKPGQYQVQCYAVRDGRVSGQTGDTLTIELTGMPALIANMAYNHALTYGIIAVCIAIAAGLLMGMLFKGKGGAH
ncbi:TIGR02186 family protein [Desulfolithobacter sp.]